MNTNLIIPYIFTGILAIAFVLLAFYIKKEEKKNQKKDNS